MTATIIPFPGKVRPKAADSMSCAVAATGTAGGVLDLPCTCLNLGTACPACAGWKRHFMAVRHRVAQRRKGGR